jgi:enoyl-CoA hydratase/carnithine racemase
MADGSSGAAQPAEDRDDFSPATSELLYERRGAIAVLTFNRPASRNAMTWAMYEGLYETCEHVDADDRVRVLVLRGAGGKAFVAGTDIAQFQAFSTADDALAYERNINRIVSRIEMVQKPTLAMIHGYCVGGGAGIAMACDLRLASLDARFGVPIARTLGNTFASQNIARLVALIGPTRAKELIFTARFIEAEEGKTIGLFNEIMPSERLESRTLELAALIAGHAPLTLRSTKEGVRRILEHGCPEESQDLILMCYMSADFREGIAAFLEKRPPRWEGR